MRYSFPKREGKIILNVDFSMPESVFHNLFILQTSNYGITNILLCAWLCEVTLDKKKINTGSLPQRPAFRKGSSLTEI